MLQCHIWCYCYCYSIMMIRWNVMILVSQYCYIHMSQCRFTTITQYHKIAKSNGRFSTELEQQQRMHVAPPCDGDWLELREMWAREDHQHQHHHHIISITALQDHNITASASAPVEASFPTMVGICHLDLSGKGVICADFVTHFDMIWLFLAH